MAHERPADTTAALLFHPRGPSRPRQSVRRYSLSWWPRACPATPRRNNRPVAGPGSAASPPPSGSIQPGRTGPGERKVGRSQQANAKHTFSSRANGESFPKITRQPRRANPHPRALPRQSAGLQGILLRGGFNGDVLRRRGRHDRHGRGGGSGVGSGGVDATRFRAGFVFLQKNELRPLLLPGDRGQDHGHGRPR
jgi:hypothetical protein